MVVSGQNNNANGVTNTPILPVLIDISSRQANDYIRICKEAKGGGRTYYDVDIISAWSDNAYYGTFRITFFSNTFHAVPVAPKIYRIYSRDNNMMECVHFYVDSSGTLYMTSTNGMMWGWSAIIKKYGNRTVFYGDKYEGDTSEFTEIIPIS